MSDYNITTSPPLPLQLPLTVTDPPDAWISGFYAGANGLPATAGIGTYEGTALISWSKGWTEGSALLNCLELSTDEELTPLPYGGRSTIE